MSKICLAKMRVVNARIQEHRDACPAVFKQWADDTRGRLNGYLINQNVRNFIRREKAAFKRCAIDDPVRAATCYEFRHIPNEGLFRCAACHCLGHKVLIMTVEDQWKRLGEVEVGELYCPHNVPNQTDLYERRLIREQDDLIRLGAMEGWVYGMCVPDSDIRRYWEVEQEIAWQKESRQIDEERSSGSGEAPEPGGSQ